MKTNFALSKPASLRKQYWDLRHFSLNAYNLLPTYDLCIIAVCICSPPLGGARGAAKGEPKDCWDSDAETGP